MSTFQQVLDAHSRDLVPAVLRLFILIYAVITASHYFLLPGAIALPMTAVAGTSVLIGLVMLLSWQQESVQRHAELLLVLLMIIMFINSGTHLYLTGDVKQTTNFVFVVAVAGFVLPTPRYCYPTLAILALGWSLLVTTGPGWTSEAVHFAFAMVLGVMFSLFLHTLRRSQLRQLHELEETVHKLDQSQKQVVAGQSLLQNLMDNIPAGIIVRNEDTSVLYANVAAKSILGQADRNVVGLKVGEDAFDLCDVNGDALAPEQVPVVRVLRNGEPIVNEVVGTRRPDGDMRWGLLNAFRLQPVEAAESVIVISFVDISERVQAEIQLRDSEERAHAILDSVLEGIITVDQDDLITLINPAAEMMTGFAEEDALGQSLTSVVHFIEDELESYTRHQGDAAPVRQGILRTRGGQDVSVELIVSEITSRDEKLGEVLTLRDVRDQLLLEQERATMDKMSSIGVLAGGIAHDFNNLLTAVYGNLAMAQASINEPVKTMTLLNRSSESIRLATNLTNQLLTFATGSDPVRRVVDVEKLIRDATYFSLSGSSITVSFDIEEEVEAVEVDDGQMQQAISNIVLNARQALDDSGLIRISVGNQSTDAARPGFVEVVIADDGPGIEPDALFKIFDPYFTTKDTGTGLGLATTHSIITKHGGSISVDSMPGTGTRFTLLLPVASAGSEIETVTDNGLIESQSALEILAMDDEEIVLDTVVGLLQVLGHRVTATRDGAEAVAEYASSIKANRRFDLVIVDLTVAGGMGGKDAAERILEMDPAARLIVSSGYSAGAEMARYKELGFRERLEKPFTFASLERVVAAALQ